MLTQHYTNPSDVSQVDMTTITAATATIDVAAYSLTHHAVITALIQRAQAGIKIRLYLDRTELEAEARGNPQLSNCPLGQLLSTVNVETKVKESSILMHLKSYLVDGKLLRDGSANFSPQGEGAQDNSLILTDDAPTIAAFQTKFETMWNRPDNISPAQAVQSSGTQHSYTRHSH